MISAGEVGAVFIIKDEAGAVLLRLMNQFNELEAKIEQVKAAFKDLSFPPGMNRSIGNMNRALSSVGEQAGRTATITKESFAAIDGSVAHTADAVAALKGEMAGLGRASREATVLARGPNGLPVVVGGGRGGSGRRPGRGYTAEGPRAHLPGGTSIGVPKSGDGFWEMVGAAAALDVVKHFLEAGGSLETAKKLLRDRLGTKGTEDQVSDATAFAIKYATDSKSGVIGSTPTENLKGITDLLSVTPTLQAAEQLYPQMMRAAKLLEELTGQSADANMKTLAKGIENTGGGISPTTGELDPARMQQAVNAAVKTIVAGGGFIDASTLFGYAKQAGGMGRITTDLDAAQNQIITALIDMGGQRSGTAIAALGRQLLGDKMTVQTAKQLEQLGLLQPGDWKKGGGTGIIMAPGKDIKGVDLIKDPDKGMGSWLNEVWAPAVKEKFIKEGKEFNPGNIMQESYKDFGQQTGQRLALMFLMNKAQQDRDIALREGVDPGGAYKRMVDQDYGANLSNLTSSLKGFEEVLGGPSTSAAIGGMQNLSAAFHLLTNAAAVSPEADKNILGGATWAGLALLAGGISKWFGGLGLGGVISSGMGAASLPAVIDKITDDNRTEQAKANDAAVEGWFYDHFGQGAADSNAAYHSLYHAGYGFWNPEGTAAEEANRERSRGLALGALPGAPVQSPRTDAAGAPVAPAIPDDLAAKMNPPRSLAPTASGGPQAAIDASHPLAVKIVGVLPQLPGDAMGVFERSMRAQHEHMADPEAARGRAMMSPAFQAAQTPVVNVAPPPLPVVNVAPPNVSVAPAQISMSPTVNVTASLDGIVAALAAKITSVILGEVRTVSGAISTDGQVYSRHPDMGGPR